ncbi:MAG: hypothetical protein U0Q16_19205 [Bryobacteraceae bacterium]
MDPVWKRNAPKAGSFGGASKTHGRISPPAHGGDSGEIRDSSEPLPMQRGYPLGFCDRQQFEECMQDLCNTAHACGIPCDTVGMRGSAVTFWSKSPHKKGHFFDQTGWKKSDLDAFIVSRALKQGANAVGFVHPNWIENSYPELEDWSVKWSRLLDRDISVAGFVAGARALQGDRMLYRCS